MKRGFVENNYQVVVNEVGSLNHHEDILQPRIYYCIIDLFNQYLGSDIIV